MFYFNKRLCALALLIVLFSCFALFYQAGAEDVPLMPMPWDDSDLDFPEDPEDVPDSPELEPGEIEIGNIKFIIKGGEEGIVDRAINYLFLIGAVAAPLMILIGAFMFFTAAGDPAKAQGAKKLIFWTVLGFTILLLAKAIVSIIRYILQF